MKAMHKRAVPRGRDGIRLAWIGKMRVDAVWLAALALSLPAVSQCDPLFVLSAPNVLRLGTMEKVFVEAQEYNGAKLEVKILVKEFPTKLMEIVSKTVTLSQENNFQAVQEITIPMDYFAKDKKSKQYVYLQARFPQQDLEKVVLVTFQSGYLFVQTDKPIYTPEDTVLYRIFSMNPGLEPISNGISVEIMNPDGITVEDNFMYPTRGVISWHYKLPEIVREGTWKVVCGFGKSREDLFTSEFEVKEYVLPSFEVKLTPAKSFFHVDDTELTVEITAKYIYGKDVSGKAFVVFGVVVDGEKKGIPASLQRVNVEFGTGEAKLTKDQILTTFPNIKELVKRSLYVSVSVLTHTGSEMVEAEKGGIQIVTSPYTIYFKKTPTYFKPGMPFDVSIYVTNPDDTPAKGIVVEEPEWKVSSTTNKNGMAKITINTQEDISTLPITVKTKVPLWSDTQQAKLKMVAEPYKTMGSKNYIHISIQTEQLSIGGKLGFSLYLVSNPDAQEKINHLTYLVISKGRIILAKRHKRLKGQTLIALNEQVTKDMVPSFRIVAYYHVGAEVVSDSVWVDVKDTCMGTLKVTAADKNTRYEPRLPFTLTVTGDPGAKVGLVAVDRGVYVLNSKNRLTQSKIWDIVEKEDIGCTTGSGANSMAVFYDAGLVFVSNTIGTAARADPHCPVRNTFRQRRSLTLIQAKQTLARSYKGLARKCCTDGMVENLMGYTCERRAQFIDDANGEDCVKAFLHCCLEVEKKTKEARTEELTLARSMDDSYFDEFSEISSRTQFPGSWLWEDIGLPPCPVGNKKCEVTSTNTKTLYMKDSITTWEVTAISVSETHGICVADPFEMTVTKSFFIDLKLPYAAVRNEQLEIKAVLYNYINAPVTARVQLTEEENVCSAASKKGKQLIAEVEVDKMSSRAVPFVIIPMALGQHTIEVKAYVVGFELRDGIKRDLRVVAEGQRTERKVETVFLNPTAYAGGEQKHTIVPVDLKSMVPGSTPQTHISVTGELLTETIDSAISGQYIGHLISQPSGCGEQNMMRITGPVIATHYLDKTNQWVKAGLDRRSEAIKYITQGYNQQLTYREKDGSFKIYPEASYKPSTWLTAYVAKVFGLAYNLISIPEDVLCSALKWLVLSTQQPDGIFKEVGLVYQSHLMGGVEKTDPSVALTAFVLIAMQESSHICMSRVNSLQEGMKLAKEFLAANINKLTDPYAVALTSYALANEGQNHLDILNRYSSGSGKTHWPVSDNHQFTLEATGYALMALVKAKEFDQAGRVVKWLTEQRFYGGFYGSTQATAIVFQAIALYMSELPEKSPIDLTVKLSIAGRQQATTWTYDPNTMHVTRSTKIPLNQNLTFTAKGAGQGTLSVKTIYNALPVEDEADCSNFDLEVKIEKQKKVSDPSAQETYLLTIDMTFKSSKRDSTMAILDITMLTGFIADQTDLRRLTSGKDQYVKNIEMNKELSEKGSIIFYLKKVSHKLPDKVAFRIHKISNVGLLQPAAITLYEYNSLKKRCMKFYHPEKKDGALNKICHEDVCQCAEEKCSYQRDSKNDLDRMNVACTGMDYVYKVKVKKIGLTSTTDRFTLLIEKTIKEGTDSRPEGQERMFLAHSYCREAIGLIEGKTYLIMGQYSSLIIQKDRMIYSLSGETWVEYWPTEAECQEPAHSKTCESIILDTEDLSTYGCPN